ncbi:Ctr copper transporter family-domain-containing protein [Dichotomopilus funicola]|uniref:Copper transport protein n=1 Tax=Dichotomopilus funicola TaxID=1934379 RepID=A0AAN6VAN1_9PEZI|nr:Ctr copper transporter family-domain-containing protein [Dichotomopilus funicola]
MDMDHSSHDHHMMDHSSHAGHGDMGSGPMCNMNMLFTWDATDLCVVFRQWHITSTLSLAVSLVAIVGICAGYEALREATRRYEAVLSQRVETAPLESATETFPLLARDIGQNREQITRRAHIIKAALYGVQNFYAFMIMLIFMTYNGWVMIAVSVGAGLGYLVFGGSTPVTKETACH